jgi:hypothetical protein
MLRRDMDIEKEIIEISDLIKNLTNYDTVGLLRELKGWLKDLNFFYNTVVHPGDNPSKISFRIPRNKKPLVGEVALFKLRRGYPKELYDSHWCYVLKDTGNSYVVIPTTSVKKDSNHCDDRFEMDIKLIDFVNDSITRMQITQIRCVDYARVMTIEKNRYKVATNKDDIISQISKVLLI